MEEGVLCPRCRVPMDYVSESERMGSERRITRYYVCPACRTKMLDERIVVRVDTTKVIITAYDYSNGKRPVIAVAAPARRKPKAPPARARAR